MAFATGAVALELIMMPWASAFFAAFLGIAIESTLQQVFRTSTDAVVIDVAVLQDGRALRGLSKEDFEVWDNGVKQIVAVFSADDAMPVDLTVMIDVSHSAAHEFAGVHIVKAVLPAAKAAAGDLRSVLQHGDRLQVLTFGSAVRDEASIDRVDVPTALELRRTALWDAIATSLMQDSDPGRRRLVVVLTDGMDTSSILDYPSLWAVADRSDAVVYIFAIATFRYGPPGAVFSKETFDDYAWVLKSTAQRTGGQYYDVRSLEALTKIVSDVLKEFRQRYLLRYVPQNVVRQGWHNVTVRVTRPGRYDVHSRKGYFWREERRTVRPKYNGR